VSALVSDKQLRQLWVMNRGLAIVPLRGSGSNRKRTVDSANSMGLADVGFYAQPTDCPPANPI